MPSLVVVITDDDRACLRDMMRAPEAEPDVSGHALRTLALYRTSLTLGSEGRVRCLELDLERRSAQQTVLVKEITRLHRLEEANRVLSAEVSRLLKLNASPKSS